MLGLQFSIGVVNDIVDAPADRAARPRKPVASGVLSRTGAGAVLGVTLVVGLAAAAAAGTQALAVGIAGLAVGLLYDLRLKGSALSWLPFAVGVGLLPLYGWWGGTARLPAALPAVCAVAVLAGAALALANALADVEVDVLAGKRSAATVLGRRGTLAALVSIFAATDAIAFAAPLTNPAVPLPVTAAEIAGAVVVWIGVAASFAMSASRRQLGWEIQAIGVTAMGGAWLAALASAGALRSA